MSAKERTGSRDLTYSRWHREDNIRRYGLNRRQAYMLGVIDIDFCEYCRFCSTPLALIETQVSTNPPKRAPVMTRLARMASVPAYSVSIELDADGEPAMFRSRRLHPPLNAVAERTPDLYAWWLLSLRTDHECIPC